MPEVANGSAVRMYYVEEVAGAIPATPAFNPIRFNTEALSKEVTQIPTNEINPLRQRGTARQGTYAVQGQILAEVSYGSHDDLLAAMFQAAWAANVLKVGTDTVKTFALIKHNSDINEWTVNRRCRVGTLGLAAALNSRALWTFGFIGEAKEDYTPPGDETFPPASTTEAMVTVQGSLYEGGNLIAYATDLNINLSNNMDPLFALFSRPAYAVQNGIFTADGSLSAYKPDNYLSDKFLNESPSDLVVTVLDAGQSYEINLPSLIYTQGSDDTPGDGALIPAYQFSAGYDATEASTVVITRTP